MGPFNVEGDLARPAGVSCRQTCRAGLAHLGEHGIPQPKSDVELFEVVGDVRIVVGIDDRDRRPRAVTGGSIERDAVETVGMPHGRRRQPRRASGGRWHDCIGVAAANQITDREADGTARQHLPDFHGLEGEGLPGDGRRPCTPVGRAATIGSRSENATKRRGHSSCGAHISVPCECRVQRTHWLDIEPTADCPRRRLPLKRRSTKYSTVQDT